MIEVDTTPKRIPLRVQILTEPNPPGAIVRCGDREQLVGADGFVTIEVEIPWDMDIFPAGALYGLSAGSR